LHNLQQLKSKSAYIQQALFREAEFSVFRCDLPAVLSGIIPIIGVHYQSAGLSKRHIV